ncbi:hypothetical protein [Priestia megaterium]|uniref:capsular polysaccharide export protein, LipB/KpsS family n=1 Tax=Priestia megaterium TaxID=1404 RepID=UPI001FB237F4|nr:hypothetical protein [Priestia megaterium]
MSKNNVNLPNNYIFIPFQVHDDSQIILNSPCIQDMEKLVNVVSEQLNIHNSKNNTDLYAVFKEHPADIGRVDYKKLYQKYKNNEKMIFLTDGDTDTILDKSKAIITVNSTVGIEGLQKYKPVIVLGNAYYDIDQITYSCKNFDQLNEIIHQALKGKLNRRLITQFLYYLRFTYQLEGNWRNGEFNYVQFLKKLKS